MKNLKKRQLYYFPIEQQNKNKSNQLKQSIIVLVFSSQRSSLHIFFLASKLTELRFEGICMDMNSNVFYWRPKLSKKSKYIC